MYSPTPEQGGRRKQSRIVIKVDEERGKQQGGSGLGRRLGRGGRLASVVALVALAALLLLGLGAYFWWQSYKKSPGYSLALLVDAAQRDDMQTVEQMVDSDRVVQSLTPQVVDSALASAGGMGALAAPRRQIEAALPQLLPGLRAEVRQEIAGGIKNAADQVGDDPPFFLLALAVPRVAESITEEGDNATVTLKRDDHVTELAMLRDGERWKLVGIRDERLAANIAGRIVGSLREQPGMIRQLENQIRGPVAPAPPPRRQQR